MLAWFDENPTQYWWLFCIVFTVTVGLIVRPLWAQKQELDSPQADWTWSGIIAALLLAGRWPELFVTRELNPDESQLISGAFTLRHDPVFWRSVDGGTAGPFDFYVLWPAGWWHGADDYFSARLTAIALLVGALIFAHQTIATEFCRHAARIGTLAAACFEALTLNSDYLHYSTELLPVFLLSGAFYLSMRQIRSVQPSQWSTGCLGLLLGVVPFTKLQAAPIAALGGMSFLIFLLSRAARVQGNVTRRIAWLVAGALVPLATLSIMLTVTHQWGNAVIPYWLNNVNYLSGGYTTAQEFGLNMNKALNSPGDLFKLFASGSILLLVITGVIQSRKRAPFPILLTATIIFLLASAMCAFTPRRPFPHYLQLTVIPLSLVTATSIGIMMRNRVSGNWCITAGGLLLSLVLVAARAELAHPEVGRLQLYQANPASAVSKLIRAYGQTGDTLCAWGWRNSYYVETRLRQATRDSFSQAEILVSPYSDYYRARYLADFNANRPAVFIDTSDTPGYPFPPRDIAHENSFPELGALIRQNYGLVGTIDKVRIFVRLDRLLTAHPRP